MALTGKQFDLGMLVNIVSTELARWVTSFAVFRLKFMTATRSSGTDIEPERMNRTRWSLVATLVRKTLARHIRQEKFIRNIFLSQRTKDSQRTKEN